MNKDTKDIFESTQDNDIEHVKSLLDSGIDINAPILSTRLSLEQTLLYWAVMCDRLEICEMLLDNSANPNIQDKYGDTALHVAGNDSDIIKLLLQYGASPSIKNKYGDTPLDIAKRYKHKKAIELLKSHNGEGE